MTVFFTADPHFGHANIIKFCDRPFANVHEMDEALISNWNAVVGQNDDIYVLGDVSFMRPQQTESVLKRLKGKKYLVRGNHDKDRLMGVLTKEFIFVKDYHELMVGNQRIVLSHFPFLTWNKSHHGSWHLHGHCHGNLPDDTSAKRLDVGVDCHGYAPIALEQVRELMALKQPFRPIDHHGAD